MAGSPIDRLVLERMGSAQATVGLISLPLPQDRANRLAPDHPQAALQPLAWWTRHQTPRRSLAMILGQPNLPATLRLAEQNQARQEPAASTAWTVSTRVVQEQLTFVPHPFTDIASLRGVPFQDTTHVVYALELTFAGKLLQMQLGGTGPDGKQGYYWQNVQVEPLWSNAVCQAIRVGGVIYNGDTYLWGDIYLKLFANGVADAAVHFHNTKLHIDGYDFQGLPLIRLAGPAVTARAATLPADGLDWQLGALQLNLHDAASLFGPEHPAQFTVDDGALVFQPVDRVIHPQQADAPPNLWPIGFARSVRFQFALGTAAPIIARYRAPGWWYTHCREFWAGPQLPVSGRYSTIATGGADYVRSLMAHHQFDAGNAQFGNDGDAGVGILRNYHLTGRPEFFQDGLDYCYYWADLHVDHCDFSVRQWVGGWGWKTCAYSKFRDVYMGYLETGDPYLRDTALAAAEGYWTWFRSNWPRNTIGRDAFEIGGWALIRRMERSDHAQDHLRELVRMVNLVVETRGTVGGQMGAGPHPGFHSSLYMTGVVLLSLCEAAEVWQEEGHQDWVAALEPLVQKLMAHYHRDDVELFPSNYGNKRKDWNKTTHTTWATIGSRVHSQWPHLLPAQRALAGGYLQRVYAEMLTLTTEEVARSGRPGMNLISPHYHDALTLGATWQEGVLELDPLIAPSLWPAEQVVATPAGEVRISVAPAEGSAAQPGAQSVRLSFSGVPLAVRLRWEGEVYQCSCPGQLDWHGHAAAGRGGAEPART